MVHNTDIDVIQCLHAITFSTGLTQYNNGNNLLNLRSIPSFTFIKHGIRNNGTKDPLQGDGKTFIYEFSVALFEFTNIKGCEQLITYSYF